MAAAPKNAAMIPATAMKYTPAISPKISAALSTQNTTAKITAKGYPNMPTRQNQAMAL